METQGWEKRGKGKRERDGGDQNHHRTVTIVNLRIPGGAVFYAPPTHTKAKYHQPHRAVTHQERGAPEPPPSGMFDLLRPPEEATGERTTGN